MEKRTPLYACHVQAQGKLVPFAGYVLPVQYQTGLMGEHMAVRTKAGLFDVSHMGELVIEGRDALENVQRLLTNDFAKMADGRVRYSPMCNDSGGIVDDLIVYRYHGEKYLLVVNAANHEKDAAWIAAHLTGEATLRDLSEETAQLALQGPKSYEILRRLTEEKSIPKRYYSFVEDALVDGCHCMISQTGYTGEDGYEIYMHSSDAPKLWDALLRAGAADGLIPCGLGARDTLRLEAGMPLYGHEMNDETTPLEAGLDFAVKLGKEDFIGKQAILEKGAPKRRRVGLKILGRGIAREHAPVYQGEVLVGETTSGTHGPFLRYAIAMAFVEAALTAPGTRLEVEVRGKRLPAEVAPLPFYEKGQLSE